MRIERLEGTQKEVKESVKKMDFREWFSRLVVNSRGCLQYGHRKWLVMSDTVIVPGTADVFFREQHQKVLPITVRPLCRQYACVYALNSL